LDKGFFLKILLISTGRSPVFSLVSPRKKAYPPHPPLPIFETRREFPHGRPQIPLVDGFPEFGYATISCRRPLFYRELSRLMSLDILLVIGVLCFAILVFIFEWVRVDVVGLIMMVALPLLGLVTPAQAISGLSSNAVVSIIGVIIIGAGLERTGIMKRLSQFLLRFAGESESRIVFLISATVAVISGFMQNIGAAALFLPAARRIGNQVGIPISRILLPMGYCAIIGGCLTLVGSSPLIMLNDLMALVDPDLRPFGLFDVTPVGVVLVLAAILYFLLCGNWVLPRVREGELAHPISQILESAHERDMVGTLFEVHVPDDFPKTVLGDLHLRSFYYASVVAVAHEKQREKNFAPMRDVEIWGGDHLAIVGPPRGVRRLSKKLGWEILPGLQTFSGDLSPDDAGVLKAVIAPRSRWFKHTVGDIQFRRKFGVNPLAILREEDVFVANLSDVTLRPGDALLLYGRWENFHQLEGSPDLIFTMPVPGDVPREDKALPALFCLAMALILILGFQVQLSIALLAGAVGMVLSRVLTIDEAYEAVDWMTIFLLAGLIPLGMAFQNSGAAKMIADGLVAVMGGGVPPLVLLGAIGLLSSFFTLVISNVGAAVLLVPLAMNLAVQAGTDPRVAALTVAVATSNSFLLPTHQVNALIMRPGGYRTVDFMRAGSGMTVLYLVVLIAVLATGYGG
jgi:di/tricarboxylate transporter